MTPTEAAAAAASGAAAAEAEQAAVAGLEGRTQSTSQLAK